MTYLDTFLLALAALTTWDLIKQLTVHLSTNFTALNRKRRNMLYRFKQRLCKHHIIMDEYMSNALGKPIGQCRDCGKRWVEGDPARTVEIEGVEQ